MFIDANETIIRLSAFLSVLCLMAILEAVFPRRVRNLPRGGRWFTNLGLVVLNSMALRLLVPYAATEAALWANKNGWGLLSLISLPMWLKVIISVFLLDMLIYWQHVFMHKIPLLWRLHKVHHADRDLDVTSGLRFHPLEIVISMIYKILCVFLIGAPVIAVILFEVILNAGALFNHANLKLPLGIDRLLRRVIVTPDFHRVHHSVKQSETNSNYGFFLTVWDFIFRSYTPNPMNGHGGMTIGLIEYQSERPANLIWCLIVPFMKPKTPKSTDNEE
ncbi:sterol desaturase family protein [Kordiimonas sp. SCSIO 12610]|uniref:sterol desaturase family protein n=1 Tax=Kordiimonas sp. SCSIO 12610 TaxID=2829597 RepID=UPI00210E3EBE|nr:sterol desaturase family protein [Kordiimonas sp. SCSIO 12610]UTW53999.1 sterol desaturase family protein [Kordiimonas sp. SCSIO 12610]